MKITLSNIRLSAAITLLAGVFMTVSINADTVINQDLKVEGTVTANFDGVNDTGDGLTKLADLSANNTSPGKSSDSGFSIQNAMLGFLWNFRTFASAEGFVATKEGTGGPEMIVRNTTDDFKNVSIDMGNGAKLTLGGVWMNASSREYKENIEAITSGEAITALKSIKPVKYNYKRDVAKDLNLGFIAEDVPELVSTPGRKNMDPMEVVAMLTKVVQHQQQMLQEQQKANEQQRRLTEELKDKVVALEKFVKLNSLVAMQ